MKRSKRVDTARDETAPVAGTWIQTASGRIVPLAMTASGKIVPLAQTASGKIVPLAQTAAAAAAPLATQAVGAVSPYAHSVAERVGPYTHTVAEKVGPYTAKATERLAPLAATGALAAHEAAEKVGPALGEAYSRAGDAASKVGPALGSARERVSDELLPKVTTTLGAAAGSPIAVEAVKRGRATLAAARGELELPEPQSRPSWLKRLAVVTTAAGVVAVVVSRVLGSSSKGSGWQAARPTTPPGSFPADTTASTPTSGTPAPSSPDTNSGRGTGAGEDTATTAVSEPVSAYGEGSYVGDEPPEGFVIKGNLNSMKYHLPDGSGYVSTKAEVWFRSEDAAKAAGFVPVQE